MKRTLPITLGIIVVIAAIVTSALLLQKKKIPYDYVEVQRRDIQHDIRSTGTVQPATTVDLAFERGGKIGTTQVDVGSVVKAGQTLMTISAPELSAQLAQAEAGLDAQSALLEQLKKGARSEDIALTESQLTAAEKSLQDAETNVDNVRQKTTTDLANTYDGVADVLRDAYAKADDAVNKQTDGMFNGALSANPSLTYLISDLSLKDDAESKRVNVNDVLRTFQLSVDGLTGDESVRDKALQDAELHLTSILNFLESVSKTLNTTVSVPVPTVTAYKTSINLARTNVTAALTNVNARKQAIATARNANQTAIAAAQTALDSAQSAVASTQAALNLKKASATPEQLAIQEAQVKQAAANVAAVQSQREKTVIRAPIDGTISKKNVTAGEIVSPNTPVLALISSAQFEIDTTISEADIAFVKTGQSATITLDAYGKMTSFDAMVTQVEPAQTVVNGVGTYKTTLQFVKPDDRIKAGMTANINIIVETKPNVLAVPASAVIIKDADRYVLVDTGAAQPNEKKVAVGITGSDGYVEILDGISEGNRVIAFSSQK
jgi:RND family efflux transporter MFP subunit